MTQVPGRAAASPCPVASQEHPYRYICVSDAAAQAWLLEKPLAADCCSQASPVAGGQIKRRWGANSKPCAFELFAHKEQLCSSAQVILPECQPCYHGIERPHLVSPECGTLTVFWCVRRSKPTFIPVTLQPEACWSVADAQSLQEQTHAAPVHVWAYTCNDPKQGWAQNWCDGHLMASMNPDWVRVHNDSWCESCCVCKSCDAVACTPADACARISERQDGLGWPGPEHVRLAKQRWIMFTLAVSPFAWTG